MVRVGRHDARCRRSSPARATPRSCSAGSATSARWRPASGPTSSPCPATRRRHQGDGEPVVRDEERRDLQDAAGSDGQRCAPCHCWTSARYTIPLPAGHRFPIAKYALLRDAACSSGLVPPERLHEPERATVDDCCSFTRARTCSGHRPARCAMPSSGASGCRGRRRSSSARSARCGGTCEAAEAALEHGVAMNLAGGTHHAFPDHGEGFCVFNDVAVAIRSAAARRRASAARRSSTSTCTRATARTRSSPATRPCSRSACTAPRTIPSTRCPARSTSSSTDGTGDDAYLDAARRTPAARARARRARPRGLPRGRRPARGRPPGPAAPDVRGPGASRRDGAGRCREVGIPVAVTIAGGYGRDVRDSVRGPREHRARRGAVRVGPILATHLQTSSRAVADTRHSTLTTATVAPDRVELATQAVWVPGPAVPKCRVSASV